MDIYMFLKGLEPDDKGRLIYQIWEFSDEEIERKHDFIQKLFPLNEPSTMSLNSLYIEDPALIERIRIDPTIANNLITSKNGVLVDITKEASFLIIGEILLAKPMNIKLMEICSIILSLLEN